MDRPQSVKFFSSSLALVYSGLVLNPSMAQPGCVFHGLSASRQKKVTESGWLSFSRQARSNSMRVALNFMPLATSSRRLLRNTEI